MVLSVKMVELVKPIVYRMSPIAFAHEHLQEAIAKLVVSLFVSF